MVNHRCSRCVWSTKMNICGDCGLCDRFEVKSSQFFASFDSLILYLKFAQMPTSRDLAIFMPSTTTDRQTNYFTPCACALDNNNNILSNF